MSQPPAPNQPSLFGAEPKLNVGGITKPRLATRAPTQGTTNLLAMGNVTATGTNGASGSTSSNGAPGADPKLDVLRANTQQMSDFLKKTTPN